MLSILDVVIIVIIGLAIRFYEKNTNAMCKSKKSLVGKTTVITGGTAGMGLEIATDFARRGARVIIACPFQEEGFHARKFIIETTGNDKVIFKLLDLSSLKSTREFASDIIREEERLDILINNAGVGVPQDFITADGMSFIMQTNYFGHFLLTLLLLPLLKKSGKSNDPSRIVNTSSVLHNIGFIGLNDLNRTDYWLRSQIYAKSKLCLVLFAHELTKKLEQSEVVVNSVDPGAVGTRIFDSAGKIYGQIITIFFRNFFKTSQEGAQTALHVALDQDAGSMSGQFYKNCKLTKAIPSAYDDKLSSKLWKDSVQCVKLDIKDLDKCLS